MTDLEAEQLAVVANAFYVVAKSGFLKFDKHASGYFFSFSLIWWYVFFYLT